MSPCSCPSRKTESITWGQYVAHPGREPHAWADKGAELAVIIRVSSSGVCLTAGLSGVGWETVLCECIRALTVICVALVHQSCRVPWACRGVKALLTGRPAGNCGPAMRAVQACFIITCVAGVSEHVKARLSCPYILNNAVHKQNGQTCAARACMSPTDGCNWNLAWEFSTRAYASCQCRGHLQPTYEA